MKEKEIDRYLKKYPQLQKWLNQCLCCGATGYRPDMPEHIGGEGSIFGDQLRRMLRLLAVDETGLCEVCRRAINGR